MDREAVSSLYFACPDTFAASFMNRTEEDTVASTKLTVKTIYFPVLLNYNDITVFALVFVKAEKIKRYLI